MPLPDLALPTLTVTPWVDPVIDAVGHDPRGAYVERFWLGILGPSTTWLVRRMVAGLDESPEGYDLDLDVTAASLGLGTRGGRHSPFVRSLARACQFGACRLDPSSGGLAVRRRMPPLTRGQVDRLPTVVREAHRRWVEVDVAEPTADEQRKRAFRLALSLLEVGEDRAAAERQLHRWKFHPALTHQAVEWAVSQRTIAGDAIAEPVTPDAA